MFICKACGISKAAENYRVHKRGYRIGKCLPCEAEYQREWSRRDPEKIRGRKREHMARRRAAAPEAVRAYQRKFHAENREQQTLKMREYAARRFFWSKANKLRGICAADLARLWRKQKGLCALTGRKLDRTSEVDHKIAKAKGGGDHITNLQWLSREANRAKRDMSDEDFISLCGDVMRWIGRRIEMVEKITKENAA